MEVKQKLAAEPAIEGIPNRSRIAPFNNRAGDGDEDVGVDPDMERKDVKIDDEVGVAVVFEEEEDAEGYQVHEECSGDEDGGDNDDAHETTPTLP